MTSTTQNEAAARTYRPSPEQEALELIVRLAGRVEVARSFARICAGLIQERAVRATVALRDGDIGRVARAAAGAAATVARSRIVASASPGHGAPPPDTPETRLRTLRASRSSSVDPRERRRDDREPASERPSERDRDDEEAPNSLDHEALHDDAC
jgi:hypothetical protein